VGGWEEGEREGRQVEIVDWVIHRSKKESGSEVDEKVLQ
jgi:hypothetical protein